MRHHRDLVVVLDPRLKPGGKYDMATLDLREGDSISAAAARMARLPEAQAPSCRAVGMPSKSG